MQDFNWLDLQLFADGAASGGTGPDAGATGGAPQGANTQTATGTEPQESGTSQPKLSFDELLKSDPDYKAAYDKRVQSAINGRFKQVKALEDRQAQLSPVLEMLGQKYGIQPGEDGSYDYAALQKAVTEDNSYYEQEALQKGVSVEALKQMKAMERENKQLKAAMDARRQREANDRAFTAVMQQAEAAKKYYPNLDLNAEMENPTFARMIASGVPVKGAYEAMHMDQILGGAMHYAVNQAQEKVANAVQAGAMRPAENGAGSQPASVFSSDPRTWSKEQRRDIRNRLARGERIVL